MVIFGRIDHHWATAKVVESAVYLCFLNGVFYHLDAPTADLMAMIQDLPMDQDRKNACIFDPTDQTAFSYSLKEFKNWDK